MITKFPASPLLDPRRHLLDAFPQRIAGFVPDGFSCLGGAATSVLDLLGPGLDKNGTKILKTQNVRDHSGQFKNGDKFFIRPDVNDLRRDIG
jgi:hypothetical protein